MLHDQTSMHKDEVNDGGPEREESMLLIRISPSRKEIGKHHAYISETTADKRGIDHVVFVDVGRGASYYGTGERDDDKHDGEPERTEEKLGVIDLLALRKTRGSTESSHARALDVRSDMFSLQCILRSAGLVSRRNDGNLRADSHIVSNVVHTSGLVRFRR
jgi:hypothetical protein